MNHKIASFALVLALLPATLAGCSPANQSVNSATPAAPAVSALVKLDPEALKLKLQEINVKAFDNEAFKQELQQDAKATLVKEGLPFDQKEKIKVLDYNGGSSLFLILDDRNLAEFYPELLQADQEDSQNELQQTLKAIRTKAKADANFKASLLADSKAVLTNEGIVAELADRFTVLDYEADTHFFYVVPPTEQISRGGSSFDSTFAPIVDSVLGLLAAITKTTFQGLVVAPLYIKEKAIDTTVAIHDGSINTQVNVIRGGIDFACAFAWWDRGCGQAETKDAIKSYLVNNIRNKLAALN